MDQGLALDAYKTLGQKAIQLDTTADKKYKQFAIQSNFYLVQYYNNVAKDIDSSLFYLKEVLKIDPSNETASNAVKTLEDAQKKAAAAQRKAADQGNKPKSSGSTAPKKKPASSSSN